MAATANYLDLQKDKGYGAMIDKVIEAKRQPIVKKETEKKKEQQKIAALSDLQKELNTLETFCGRLWGPQATFNDFKFTSDNPAALAGSAKRPAVPGSYTIKILELASAARFQGRDVTNGEVLPASDLTFRQGAKDWAVRFGGGSLNALVRAFDRPDLKKAITLSTVRRSTNGQAVILASEIPGPSGRIALMKDTGNLMKILGLFTDAPVVAADGPRPRVVMDGINTIGTKVPDGSNGFWLEPRTQAQTQWSEPVTLAAGETLEWKVTWYPLPPTPTNEGASNGVAMAGPDTSMNLPLTDRLTLDGDSFQFPMLRPFDASRLDALENDAKARREAEEARLKAEASRPAPVTNGRFLQVLTTAGREIPLDLPAGFETNAGGMTTFRLRAEDIGGEGTGVKSLTFTNGNSHHRLSVGWVRWIPAPPPPPASNVSPWRPAQEIAPAKGSRLEYRGVVVERDGNTVNDLIDGVSLELRQVSPNPVGFRIDWNEEAIGNSLVNFVGQYNLVMESLNVLMNTDKPPVDGKPEVTNKWGMVKNDLSLSMLKEKLRRIVIDPHKTSEPEKLAMLSQTGIEPLYIRGNPNDINVGKLDYKEDKVKRTLREMPDLFADLFAFDTDGDRLPDVGVALETGRLARGYHAAGAILAIQKETSTRRIKSLEDEIKRDEASVASYRTKLVHDFSELEKAQKEMERMSKSIDGMNPR